MTSVSEVRTDRANSSSRSAVTRPVARSLIPYLLIGIGIFVIGCSLAYSNIGSRGELGGLLVSWAYSKALILSHLWAALGLRSTRFALNVVGGLSYLVVALGAWLTVEKWLRPARFGSWGRALLAWIVIEIAYSIVVVLVATAGILSD